MNPYVNPIYQDRSIIHGQNNPKAEDGHQNLLPNPISLKDIDTAFFRFWEHEDGKIVFDGAEIPTIYMTQERWNEYNKTFTIKDAKTGNILLPIMTVRNIGISVGTRLGDKMNVPLHQYFEAYRVRKFDGNYEYDEIYKIPQPTNVDVRYEVKIYAVNNMNLINHVSERVLFLFNSITHPIYVNDCPMNMKLENITDSNKTEYGRKRVYERTYTILVQGYVRNNDDVRIERTAKRLSISANTSRSNRGISIKRKRL